MAKKIRKAIFPVAGLGTRFIPATKVNPKEMLPIVDKPLIQYAVEDAVKAGITNLIFINGRNKRAIEDHFDSAPELEQILLNKGKHQLLKQIHDIIPLGANCINIRQKEPSGLGNAVFCARATTEREPFAVVLADDLIVNGANNSIKQMLEYHEEYSGNIVMVEELPHNQVSNYGIIEGKEIEEGVWKVDRLVEKPNPQDTPSNLGIIGRYILSPSIFKYIKQTPMGVGEEIQLTDAIALQMQYEPLHAVLCKGKRYDCGSKLGYLQANVDLALKHKEIKKNFKAYLKSLVESEDF